MVIKSYLKSDNSKIHDKIVRSVVAILERDGYLVKTSSINHPHGKPKQKKGFIPDVYATKGFQEILIEVETCSSLSSQNLKKWKRFGFNKNCQFWVVVPPSCTKKAITKKQTFNLPVDIYCSNGNGKLEKTNSL